MKRYKNVYFAWQIILIPLAILWRIHCYSGTLYFVINMVAVGVLNLAVNRFVLKVAREHDEPDYDTFRNALLTRMYGRPLHSSVPEVEKEIQAYKGLLPLSIANIIIVVLAMVYINLL